MSRFDLRGTSCGTLENHILKNRHRGFLLDACFIFIIILLSKSNHHCTPECLGICCVMLRVCLGGSYLVIGITLNFQLFDFMVFNE